MTNFEKLEKFCNENPENAAVKSLISLSNKPISINGNLGQRLSQVHKMAEQAYA
jgi:hypothetical protein